MSDTPRSDRERDYIARFGCDAPIVSYKFACELEVELNKANDKIVELIEQKKLLAIELKQSREAANRADERSRILHDELMALQQHGNKS